MTIQILINLSDIRKGNINIMMVTDDTEELLNIYKERLKEMEK